MRKLRSVALNAACGFSVIIGAANGEALAQREAPPREFDFEMTAPSGTPEAAAPMAAEPVATSPEVVAPDAALPEKKNWAYPDGQFYEHLSSVKYPGTKKGLTDGYCGPCGPYTEKPCDWGWGAGGSPFRNGPGRCDTWDVGPRWHATVDGAVLMREGTNVNALVARSNALQDPASAAAPLYTDNFEQALGGRVMLYGYFPQCEGYEIQAGYFGAEEWHASAIFPAVPPGLPIDGPTQQRELNYDSALHSGEINFSRLSESRIRPYWGARYIKFDEDIRDATNGFAPLPIDPGDVVITNDLLKGFSVENQLVGFQGGLRCSMWQVNDWFHLQGFTNGGVYCNMIERVDLAKSYTTRLEVSEDDPTTDDTDESGTLTSTTTSYGSNITTERTRISFVGEASIAGVCQLNPCTALRAGYQVMFLNGLELADDAFLGIDPRERNLVFHGWFAGLEYRR